MPINWDATMDRKLLLAILKHHSVAVDSAAVAQELSTDDQPCTAMAIQKRLQKIRDMMKNGDGGEETPKAKSTTRKRATNSNENRTLAKKPKTKKAGKASEAALEHEDDEGASVSVKPKVEVGEDDWLE